MSCLMLLASLRGLLPSRSLLRVGRLFLGATALHTPVVRGQETADTLGSTFLDGFVATVDTAGDELRHRCALGQPGCGGGIDRVLGGRTGGLPALVGRGLPRAGCHPVRTAAIRRTVAVRGANAHRGGFVVARFGRTGLLWHRSGRLAGRDPLRGPRLVATLLAVRRPGRGE